MMILNKATRKTTADSQRLKAGMKILLPEFMVPAAKSMIITIISVHKNHLDFI